MEQSHPRLCWHRLSSVLSEAFSSDLYLYTTHLDMLDLDFAP